MPGVEEGHPIQHQHHSFLGVFPSYFAQKARAQVLELFVSTAILDLAVAMVLLFEPIYLYKQGFSLIHIMFFYLGVYGLYFFTLPLGAKFAKWHGCEKSILVGTVFYVFYFLALALIAWQPWFIVLASILLTLQKTFYWPGYHGDFAKYSLKEERGREIGNMIAIVSTVFVIGPLLGGLISSIGGFTMLFIVASILILLSNLPLMITKEEFRPSHFSYTDALKRIFNFKEWRSFLSFIGYGEELIVMTMWPIFIYIVLKNNVLSVGGIIALSTLVTSVAILFIGKLTDKKNELGVLRSGSLFRIPVWFGRAIVTNGFGVFLVDIFSRISKTMVSVPLTALIYTQAKRSGVMNYIIYFEMILVLGKILAILGVLVILTTYQGDPWFLMFALGALFSIFYSFARK